MQKIGIVSFGGGGPVLDDGTLLANQTINAPNPFIAAVTFLQNKGIHDSDRIRVTGNVGSVVATSVFFMTDAEKLAKYLNVVLEYGAKGDASTDDTVAIQAAINETYNNSGPSTVFFPLTGLNSPTNGAPAAPSVGTPPTTYVTSYPLFNPYAGNTLLGESGSFTDPTKGGFGQMIYNSQSNAPVLCMGETLFDPIYTDRGEVTTALVKTNNPAGTAVTTTTAAFDQPASPGTVDVDVVSTNGFFIGQWVWIDGGGYYIVAPPNTAAPNILTLKNSGTACNAAPAPTPPAPPTVSKGANVFRTSEGFAGPLLISQGPLGDLHGNHPYPGAGRVAALITADFVQPPVRTQTPTPVQVDSAANLVAQQLVWIPNAGDYVVAAVVDEKHIRLENLGTFLSLPPGTVVHVFPDQGPVRPIYDMDGLGAITTTVTGTPLPVTPGSFGDVTVASTAGFHLGDYIWIQGAGLFQASNSPAKDGVTLPVFNCGGAARFNPASGTIKAGALVSKNGFCVEFYIDPVTDIVANVHEYRQVISSSGQRGSASLAQAFSIALTGDLNNTAFGQPPNSIHAEFTTTTTQKIFLDSNGLNHPVGAGKLTHVALAYDGVTIRLFINGSLAASKPLTGAVLQQHMEVLALGLLCVQWPDSYNGGAQHSQNGFQIGGIRIAPYPLYQDQFQPPTAEPSLLDIGSLIPNLPDGYGTQLLLNFSQGNRKFVAAAPNYTNPSTRSTNLAEGWIIAQQNLDYNNNVRDNWLFWSPTNSVALNYTENQRVANLGFGSKSAAIHMNANRESTIEHCAFKGGRGIDVCNFSYHNMIDSCQFSGTFDFNKSNVWSWAVGFLGTSQFPCVRNADIEGGFAYNFVSCGGGLFESVYGADGYFGNYLFPDVPASLNGNTVTIIECYVSDDQSQCNDCLLFAGYLGSLNIKGGYFELSGSGSYQVPVFKIDGTSHADIQCCVKNNIGTPPTFKALPAGPPIFFFTPATLNPVRFAGSSTYAIQGFYQPLMPETGQIGQGPLYVIDQELFGENIVNLPDLHRDDPIGNPDPNQTLLVDDFLWGRLVVMGANATVTRRLHLPSIAGYRRRVFNSTTGDIICIGIADTGPGVLIPVGASATIYCRATDKGTKWVAD